ncbi:MAG: GNAT family N-acetyltransferase [Gaiellaceae bacterium]
MAGSLRSFEQRDRGAVLELSRHALQRPEEQVGNPLWTTSEELESELSDWEVSPEETLLVEEAEGEVVGFGGVEVSSGFEHADLFGPLIAPGHLGPRLGALLLEASVERAENQGARKVIASVGTHNKSGGLLLERAGFQSFGNAQAVFRLHPSDHRPGGPGPEGVTVRRGLPGDLEQTLRLYRECFPDGVFPESAWREALGQGAVYIGESQAESLAVVNIDPSDRWIYHLGVVESERDQGVGSYVLSRALTDYWANHPHETLGLTVHSDNLPALRLYRRQGFAPLLVLQSFELPL